MVNGVLSRKVEITLNNAVSLVQTVQPLLFIPCYKSGCGELRGVTRRSRNAFEPQLAYNGSGIAEGRDLKDKSFNLAQIPIEVQTIFNRECPAFGNTLLGAVLLTN